MQDELLVAWGEGIEEVLLSCVPPRSHRWLAGQIGVHPTTIDRIVKGEIDVSIDIKANIAAALGQRMDVLWGWPKIIPAMPVGVSA